MCDKGGKRGYGYIIERERERWRDGEMEILNILTDIQTRKTFGAKHRNLYPMLVMEELLAFLCRRRGKGHEIVKTLALVGHTAHTHEVLSRGTRAGVTHDTLVHGLSLLHTEGWAHHAHPHLHREQMRRQSTTHGR